MGSTWLSMQSSRLPRPLKEWTGNGLEFTDGGLGIGSRFGSGEAAGFARRSPGPAYNCQDFGSVSKWQSDVTLPTKQPCAKYHSTEVHRMGARRDAAPRMDSQMQPGPGTYELKGFAQQLADKSARRRRQTL